jgi:exodeoxyribonuclease VII large subunit
MARGRKKETPPEAGLFDAVPPASSSPEPPSEPAPEPPPEPTEERLTVTALTALIERRLTSLGKLAVEGELSRITRAASGHVYFDLKDEKARLSCVVWRSGVRRAFALEPEEGAQVVVRGKLDVYAPRGSYSLIAERVEPVGVGALLAQLEALKADLAAKGWFERARPIPARPRLVGVVTSRDGAALRDFLKTRSARWAGYPVRLCHSAVQGPGAARSIADAIAALDRSGVDVVVVCRGGGSLEDLWAFNEEPVARAIWECSVPVVSGVGHETDTSLADLVADHRAHTPTDAAQVVIPDRAALDERLARLGNYLVQAATGALDERTLRVAELARRPALRDPGRILGDRARELRHLRGRLATSTDATLSRARGRVQELGGRLERGSPRRRLEGWARRLAAVAAQLPPLGAHTVERARARVAVLARGLDAISPLAVLGRGYSLTRRADGTPVTDAAEVAVGDELETRLAKGRVVSDVRVVEP